MIDIIEGDLIRLVRLKEEHLEMVRGWRNSDYVKQGMIFRGHISEDQQKEWFKTINNDQNYFFVVEYGGKPVALSSLKNIHEGMAEPGFFLAGIEYEDTDITARASITLGYVARELLSLHKLYIHVLRSNKRAIKYNLFSGYKIIEEQSTAEVLYMETSLDENIRRVNKLKEYLKSKTT